MMIKGKVFLVGAGPGDEGLITVKGQHLLQGADAVVYDYLANPGLLGLCRKEAQLIYVGKKAGNHTLVQEEIEDVMIRLAREGKQVVRLKGGDPYVFGRGGEEGEHLHKAGIPFEVVPGISSAIGGLACAGIPVTFRNIATSFHVVTGHLAKGTKEPDYKALAALDGTLIFLMGIGNRKNISDRLMEAGKCPRTKVAVVFNASTPQQMVVETTLADLTDALAPDEDRPGVIVMGDVVEKRAFLDFHSKQPFKGIRFLVTRAAHQTSQTAEKIAALGGAVNELPTIAIQPIPVEQWKAYLEHLKDYTQLIFTSPNSVQVFLKGLLKAGYDMRALSHVKISAIGRMTAQALLQYHLKADFMSENFLTEGLIDTIKAGLAATDRILIPRSDLARPLLADWLVEICPVDSVAVYNNTMVEHTYDEISHKVDDVDFLLFTSASTVENLMAQTTALGIKLPQKGKWVSIGPATSEKIRAYGKTVHIEAEVHTVEGMLDAIIKEREDEDAT